MAMGAERTEYVAEGSDVTELVFFSEHTANEAEAEALQTVQGLDGCLRVYHGSRIEESSTGIWVQGLTIRADPFQHYSTTPDWQSLNHHEAFQKSDIYPSFVAGVTSFAKSVASILHVPLKPYPASASFEAPVTEVLVATLKPDASRDDFEKIIDMMHKGCKVTTGALSSAHGITLENDRKYVYVCGWDAIETHHKALEPEYAQMILNQLRDLADVEVKHFRLQK